MSQSPSQSELFQGEAPHVNEGPVVCFGITFENDDARREYFLALLREGLEDLEDKLKGIPFTSVDDAVIRMQFVEKWPMGDETRLRELAYGIQDANRKDPEKDIWQLWKDYVGFPHGEIEDILSLSDPPYFTACPNPFISNYIERNQTHYKAETNNYHREPYATDVSEGKTGPIYNAHSYHTKVPYLAIQNFIEHYTDPGDLILDGFAGSGMTGVATLAANENRHSILIDLCPAATFISNLYNTHVDPQDFSNYANRIIREIEEDLRPLFLTVNPATGSKIMMEYVIWSTVLVCPHCTEPSTFWDFVKNDEIDLLCPKCGVTLARNELDYLMESFQDDLSGEIRQRNVKKPVLINYKFGKKRYSKEPDSNDYDLLTSQKHGYRDVWIPNYLMLGIGEAWGDTYRAGYHRGYEFVYDFYFPRVMLVLSKFREKALESPRYLRNHLLSLLTSVAFASTHLYKYRTQGGGQPAGNNLYIPALIKEQNIFSALRRKLRALVAAENEKENWNRNTIISTGSSTQLNSIPNCCVDYIFADPPFGANIMYSESNFLWESWLKVQTNQHPEAIMNQSQNKGLSEYQKLITRCFSEYFRVLKPGRWSTVEFHNSQNSIWTSIQEALGNAGFVVADIRTLDKKQGTFKQVTSPGAVKQDLIISAYKPNTGLERRFRLVAGREEGAWDFIKSHLNQLPVFNKKDNHAEVIAERQAYLLYDRMIAFHVQRGVTVPLSAADFYSGLSQRFPERDGMYFLPEQAAEYDKKRLTVKEILQLQLFVTDEETSIQWLKQQINQKPQTFQELHPQFLKEIGGWQKHEKSLELFDLLEENFLRYNGEGAVPSQIHSYLSTNYKDLRNLGKEDTALQSKAKDRWYVPDPNKQADLEKLREKTLLREFEEYKGSKQRRLKVFRLEAVRAGFKKAWQDRDYATIIEIAEKIPENVLQEDPKLLMWYDQAITRSSD